MTTSVSFKQVYGTLDFLLTQGAVNSVAFTTNPVAGTTLTINGAVAQTFVASGGSIASSQINLGVTLALTLANVVTQLNADTQHAGLAVARYFTDGTNLILVSKAIGTVGNSYTLSTNVAGATVTNATFQYGGAWNAICMTSGQIVSTNGVASPAAACALWARQQNYSPSTWLTFSETILGGGTRMLGGHALTGWSTSLG